MVVGNLGSIPPSTLYLCLMYRNGPIWNAISENLGDVFGRLGVARVFRFCDFRSPSVCDEPNRVLLGHGAG